MCWRFFCSLLLLAGFTNNLSAQVGKEVKGGTPKLNVTGEWTGAWGPYGPYQSDQKPDAKQGYPKLDCTVVRKGKAWQATFEGESGQPYKFTVKMDGRQVGDVMLFKGTVHIPGEDGGEFDWIGRATEKEFIGFFTGAKSSGVFLLARKQ